MKKKNLLFLLAVSMFIGIISCSPEQQDIRTSSILRGRLNLPELDGSEVFHNSDEVFNSIKGIELSEIKILSQKTSATTVEVYERVQDDDIKQMLKSFSNSNNLDDACLTQSQIVYLCFYWSEALQSNKSKPIFLFKEKNDYYIARINSGWMAHATHLKISHIDEENDWISDEKPLSFVIPM